jgi:hypothetical protein
MSMADRYLLYRAGRDQFGDRNPDSTIERYMAQRQRWSKTDKEAMERQRERNCKFLSQYRGRWLGLFTGKSKKDAWKLLYPDGKPALSTFNRHAARFASLEEFLLRSLVDSKWLALLTLGYSRKEIATILEGHDSRYILDPPI